MGHPGIAWAHVTLDCNDVDRISRFWADLLGLRAVTRDGGWAVLGPTAPGGPMIYFQPVPEPKVGKARAHIDLWVDDIDAAIRLVEELGGTRTDDIQVLPGRGSLVVMADPEGNELCLITFPVPGGG